MIHNLAVNVLLTGLTLIDNSKYPDVGNVDAHLIERPRAAASDFYQGGMIPRHVPFLMVDDAAAGKPPDYDVQVRIGSRLYDVYLLRNSTVVFVNTASGIKSPLVIDYVSADDQRLCSRDQDHVACAPAIQRICKKCGSEYTFDVPSMAARFVIDRGELRVPTTEIDRVTWSMSDGHTKEAPRVLPQLLELYDDTATTVDLKITENDNPNNFRTIKVTPTDQGQVVIGSAPAEDVMAMFDHHQLIDYHFEAYYDGVTRRPKLVPIPHLVKRESSMMMASDITLLFVHSSNCPPALIK